MKFDTVITKGPGEDKLVITNQYGAEIGMLPLEGQAYLSGSSLSGLNKLKKSIRIKAALDSKK